MIKQKTGEPFSRISSKEASHMLKEYKQSCTVIDVRDKSEYESGHVTGALWVPVEDIITRYDELPSQNNLLFICQMGVRSALAAEYAAAMGADTARLFSIDDGTPGWIENGLPVSYGQEL